GVHGETVEFLSPASMLKENLRTRKIRTFGMVKAFLTCALLCAMSVAARAGTTYYVATNGDDKNPGTSALPLKTIARAADLVNPGDTVLVRNGVYAERDSQGDGVSLKRGGTAEAPVLFKSENKW